MSIPIINLTDIANITRELSNAGAYGVCIEETWSMNILLFSMLNIVTIVFMMVLQKEGKHGLSDRLLNVLFLFNVISLTVNVVIALGFKFLPV